MKIIALDLSSKTGWAKFSYDKEKCKLISSGLITLDHKLDYQESWDKGNFWDFFYQVQTFADKLFGELIAKENFPYVIVIERTNLGRQRSSQTFLEWLHFCFLMEFSERQHTDHIYYLDSSQWRKAVGMLMSKDDKKNNRDVNSGKKRGKITKKHLSVRLVNEMFKDQLTNPLKIKDNDISDAILLGYAWWKINHGSN